MQGGVRPRPTVQDGAICGQKSILQGLLYISLLESVLFGNDLMYIFSGEMCDFLSTVTIVDTKERETLIRRRWRVIDAFLLGLEVEDGTVGVFHTYAPPLHSRQPVNDAFVSSAGGRLDKIDVSA
jgi:hypothetical protein